MTTQAPPPGPAFTRGNSSHPHPHPGACSPTVSTQLWGPVPMGRPHDPMVGAPESPPALSGGGTPGAAGAVRAPAGYRQSDKAPDGKHVQETRCW